MKLRVFLIVYLVLLNTVVGICPNNCSSHGKCVNSVCECYSDSESGENYVGSDCSLRGCSVGNPFSAVGSVYGSSSKVYGSSSSRRELSSIRRIAGDAKEAESGYSLKLADTTPLNGEKSTLWKVSGIEELVYSFGGSGGVISCDFTDKDGNIDKDIEVNVISHTSTSTYVLFNRKVKVIGDAKNADEYKSVTCTDILTIRNDLTQLNPIIVPEQTRLLTNNNTTRKLAEKTTTFSWTGYYPILKDMGLLKAKTVEKDVVYESDNFIFACYTPLNGGGGGARRELTGDNEILSVELKIYKNVKAEKGTGDNDVLFTVTDPAGTNAPDAKDICLCAMYDDGNEVDLEKSDISKNIRKETEADGKVKYYIGKYNDAESAKSDHVAFGTISGVNDKTMTLQAMTDEDDKLHFGENRVVYGTVLEDGYFKEVEVMIKESSGAEAVKDLNGAYLLPYLRSSAIDPLTPALNPKAKVVGTSPLYTAYYFYDDYLKSLKKEGGILNCKYDDGQTRERMLAETAVEVDVRGIIRDSKGVIIYSYIEVRKKADGTDFTVESTGTLECDGIKSIRNDMTKYKGLSLLTLGSGGGRQLDANELEWSEYGNILKNMGYEAGQINFGCFKKDDKTKEIVDFGAKLEYITEGDKAKFTFEAGTNTGDYLCFMKTKSNQKEVILEESDIKDRIVYDDAEKKYYYGEYLISATTRYVKEGESEVIILSEGSEISLDTTKSITIPDFDTLPSDIIAKLKTQDASFSLKVIKNENSKYKEMTIGCKISSIADSTRRLLVPQVITFTADGYTYASGDVAFHVMYLAIPTPSPDVTEPPYTPANEIRSIDTNSYFYEVSNFLDDIKESLPLIGGKIECKIDEDNNIGLIDIRGIKEDKIFMKLEKPLIMRRRILSGENGIQLENIRDCRILSIRKDMSLYNVLQLSSSNYDNVKGIISWNGYGEIFSSIKGNIVCYTPNSENKNIQMIVYSNIVINRMKNQNSGLYDINIQFAKDNSPKEEDICYMLSDSSGRNIIDIKDSELSGILVKEGDSYYFGSSEIDKESGKSEEKKKSDGSVEISFDKNKYLNEYTDDTDRFDKKNENKIDLFDINSDTSPSVYIPSDMIGIEGEKMIIIGNTLELLFIDKLSGESWIGRSQILKIEKDSLNRFKISLSNRIYLPPKTNTRLRSLATVPTISTNLIIKLNWKSEGSTHVPLECSGQGICDRESGLCKCFDGYSGSGCQRLDCPNNCNGNGRCVALSELLSNPELEKYIGFGNKHESTLKDDNGNPTDNVQFDNQVYGCLCDKRHRGYDCSLIECPSGEDPEKATNMPNTDDEKRDCSGRGICDYKTGICECFEGFNGEGCQNQVGTM